LKGTESKEGKAVNKRKLRTAWKKETYQPLGLQFSLSLSLYIYIYI